MSRTADRVLRIARFLETESTRHQGDRRESFAQAAGYLEHLAKRITTIMGKLAIDINEAKAIIAARDKTIADRDAMIKDLSSQITNLRAEEMLDTDDVAADTDWRANYSALVPDPITTQTPPVDTVVSGSGSGTDSVTAAT